MRGDSHFINFIKIIKYFDDHVGQTTLCKQEKAPRPPFKAVSRESFLYLNSSSSSIFIKSMASDGGAAFGSSSHLRSQGMSTPLCKLSASTCSCILLVVSPSLLFAQQSTTREIRCPPQSEVSGLQICDLIYIRWLRVLGDGVVGAGLEVGYIMLLVGVAAPFLLWAFEVGTGWDFLLFSHRFCDMIY